MSWRSIVGSVNLTLAAVWLLVSGTQGAESEGTKRVLMLFSEDKNLPANVSLEQSARAELEKGRLGRVEFYTEHLDASRFPGENHYRLFREYLREKYAAKQLDLVMTFVGGRFELAGQLPGELFPDLPLVFFAMSDQEVPPQVRNPRTTGMVQHTDAVGTINLMLKVRPETRRVMVVAGTSSMDRMFFEPAAASLHTFSGKLEFEFWTNRPATELRSAVAGLPADSAVFYVSMSRDVAGQSFYPRRMAQVLAANSSVPVFVLFDTMVGEGPVGGSVTDFAEVGARAGQMAAGILDGKSPADYPIEVRTNGVAMVDWHALRRWGIGQDRLPSGSIVRFRPPTIWEQHRGFIIATLCIVLGQTVTIAVLLVQRQRRQRAELEARELAGRLLTAQEDERARLARGLHDGLGQRMALMAVELEMFGQRPPDAPGQVTAKMNELSVHAKESSAELHRLSHGLHPAKLEQLGLATATTGFCREVEQAHGIAVQCECQNVSRWLPPAVALCLYRVMQEALQNVAKHSGAKSVTVELAAADGEIRLNIGDDGKGFDIAAVSATAGLGLVSMRERVRLVHGKIHWRSQPGRGTRVLVRVPLPAAGATG